MTLANKAQKPNPALGPLKALVGEWVTVGTHPYLPGQVLRGRTTAEWIEGGAFLLMRSEIDHPEMPCGVSVFGSDDGLQELYMLYFDERGVSRRYDVVAEGNTITWHRDDPAFAQRMVLTFLNDGSTIECKGEMKRDGGSWEPDLQLTYARA
jgi:hypothetical protein